MRMGCLQLDAVLGDPAASMARADALLTAREREAAAKGGRLRLDVLVLPEMAFAGYTFESSAEVLPLAERAGEGACAAWCRRWASRLSCVVVCGFPRLATRGACEGQDEGRSDREVVANGSSGSGASRGTAEAEAAPTPLLYNSQLVMAPDGSMLAAYDKSFLYVTDKTWATEGAGFSVVELPPPLSLRCALGICMDINPYEFEAPFEAYELARFCAAEEVELLLFSSAWCNRHPEEPPELAQAPDGRETLEYWASRLQPLIRRRDGGGMPRRAYFVCADRVGVEHGTTFCGTSCVLSLAEPAVLGALGTHEQGLLLCELTLDDRGEEEWSEESAPAAELAK